MFGAESYDLTAAACYTHTVQSTTAATVLELPTRGLNKTAVGKRLLLRLTHYVSGGDRSRPTLPRPRTAPLRP